MPNDTGSPEAAPVRPPPEVPLAAPVRSGLSGVRWALALSVLAHLLLVAAFLAGPVLPDRKSPEEEAVTVEMVPPPPEPETKDAPKPEEPKPDEHKPEEKTAETPPAAPRVATRPTLSTAPERPDQLRETENADRTVETRPDAPSDQAETAAPQTAEQPGAPERAPGASATSEASTPNMAGPAPTRPDPPAAAQDPAPRPDAAQADPAILAQTPTRDAADAAPSPPDADDGFSPTLPDGNAPTPSARPASAAAAAAGGGGALKAAKVMNRAPVLKDPLARFALGQMPRKQQVQNLCAFEAAAQILRARPDSKPEGVLTGPVTGNTLTAEGSFYKSRGKRYAIDFTCTVNLNTLTVTEFRYRLGSELPADRDRTLQREGL